MGLCLTLAKVYVPQFMQKRKLEILFKATAEAFQVAVPSTRGLPYNDRLILYAQFTREQADQSIQQGNHLEVQSRLFQNAYRIGRQFKTDFKINTAAEVMQMGAIIYKLLKIEFAGELKGHIVMKQCFFGNYYSGNVCRLISSLDEGLLAGLSGGGKLSFSERISEGSECCRALLEIPGGCK